MGTLLYRRGLSQFVALARSLPGMRTVAVHHGTPGDPWVPALSDIDLALSVEDGSPEFLERFWPRYRLLRRRWPFLQEVMIATPEEWKSMSEDPIAGFEVGKCEPVWGEPFPAPAPVADPFWAARPRLIRALSLWIHHASGIGWRPRGGAFRRAFSRRLLGKIAELSRQGAGAALPEDPRPAWEEALRLLEEGCRGFLEDPRVAAQSGAEARVPPVGREAAVLLLQGVQRAHDALREAGGLPGATALCAFDPLRNGLFRVLVLAVRTPPEEGMLRLAAALRADPLVLGPWSRRFLCEVMDPLRWASAQRDDALLQGEAPGVPQALRQGILSDWMRWECARFPYVLRLLDASPASAAPGYLEHQWRRLLALELCVRRGLLEPQSAEPAATLARPLALSQTLRHSARTAPSRASSTERREGRS